MEFSKKDFLEQYLIKQRELSKRQREYKQSLNCKLGTRAQNIVDASVHHNLQLLKLEKDELKTQVWTSIGKIYELSDKQHLNEIKCHIKCQEHLYDDIHQIKIDIANMKREISRITRKIYEINLKIVPDAMHQLYVARSRKKMQLLENQLEVGVRRECIFTALNAKLRETLADNIHFRRYFDDSYFKMVEKLNGEKKYINDLIEYVLNIYEHSIELCDKSENRKRDVAKKDLMYADMVNNLTHDEEINAVQHNFHLMKLKERHLADLEPKEYRRRDRMRQISKGRLELYTNVLEKIMNYTNSTDGIKDVIKKFKEQESLYYSYFNYANEMSYHMTLLNNSMNCLFDEIKLLEKFTDGRQTQQLMQIEELEEILENKRENNKNLMEQRDAHDGRINNLLDGIGDIFHITHIDPKPLMLLLGNHVYVDLVNVRQFLKLIEQRISDITATVYFTQREISKTSRVGNPVVKGIEHRCEDITDLDVIVMAQQCPECAEGEAVNDVEDGDAAVLLEEAEFKKRLYERIKQPEMQYRLHSISQCRLPRSRLLAAKR